jgi:hypothetical protein
MEDVVVLAIDVDPETLSVAAAASSSAYDKAITHVAAEIAARDPAGIDALVATLAPEGPYAYTILPQVGADGSVKLPVLSSREEIRDAYTFIRGMSDLHEVIGLTEIRSTWYTFQDNISRGGPKGTEVRNNRETLAMFPSGAGDGITGELVWVRVPRSQLGGTDEVDVTGEDRLLARAAVYAQHAAYLDALRANDLHGVLGVIHDLAASAVRDYVAGSGTLVELTGKAAHHGWYSALFERYSIESVQPIYQVTEDWYVFAELRITATDKAAGRTVAFHTAEFHMPAKDGRFIARIGHGTEPT